MSLILLYSFANIHHRLHWQHSADQSLDYRKQRVSQHVQTAVNEINLICEDFIVTVATVGQIKALHCPKMFWESSLQYLAK